MKALANWGHRHPWPARILIFFGHVYIGTVGFELGLMLFANGVRLPATGIWMMCLLFLGAVALYPQRHQAVSFFRRKAMDSVLVATLALMWVGAGNRCPQYVLPGPAASMEVVESVLRAPKTPAAAVAGLKSVTRGVNKIVQHRIEKRMTYFADKGTGLQLAAVIVLGLLGFVAIAYLTAALSCSLSCSGNEAAAVLVLVLGILLEALLIWGIIVWGRKIRQKTGTAP